MNSNMAFLREYELRSVSGSEVLIKYFFACETDVVPTIVFRLNIRNMSLHVERVRFCSNTVYLDEIRRLFDFLDFPYWRSVVKLVTPGHRFKDASIDGLL